MYFNGERQFQECVTAKRWSKFMEEVKKLEREAAGTYVPRNMCDDNYWSCTANDEDVTKILESGVVLACLGGVSD